MLIINQTQLYDNQIIWVVKITLDTGVLYFSTTRNSITLDGILFDGKVIFDESGQNLSDVTKSIDISQGGSIGQVGNFNFSLARYNTHSSVKNFVNDFYPETDKPLLTSREINVGWVYEGATSLSQITWFSQSYIEDPQYENNKINLGCIEYDELVETTIPYYAIQKDFDNGISYFPNAPDESFKQVIPIVYGDIYSDSELIYCRYLMSPCIRVDKTDNIYIATSHIVKTPPASIFLYKYLSQPDTMMGMEGVSAPGITNNRRGMVIALSANSSLIYGFVYLPLKRIINSGYFNYFGESLIDPDPDTASLISKGISCGLQMGYSMGPSEFGELFCSANFIQFSVIMRSNDTNEQTVELGLYNSSKNVDNDPDGYAYKSNVSINGSGGAKSLSVISIGALLDPKAFTIDDMQKAYFTIKPDSGNSGDTNVYHVYVKFARVRIYDLSKIPTITYIKPQIIHINTGYVGGMHP